jgi:phage shock protein E
MHWAPYLILAAAIVLFFVFKNARQISPQVAHQYLKDGALLIDVRSPREFNSGHLAQAINLPLDQIQTTLPRHVKEKDKVLLLHCQSGARSGVAQSRLKALGYTNAFNLGSYARAAKIAGGK